VARFDHTLNCRRWNTRKAGQKMAFSRAMITSQTVPECVSR